MLNECYGHTFVVLHALISMIIFVLLESARITRYGSWKCPNEMTYNWFTSQNT